MKRNDIQAAKKRFREEAAKVRNHEDLEALNDLATMLVRLQDDGTKLETWMDRHWPKLPKASER